MKRIIKKIIKIILILMLIISLMTACTYKAYAASAAGVVVAGGSIGTGGAAAGLLGLMGPVTAILGVALAAYGISVILDESAEAQGVTKTQFLYDKVTEYNEQRNLSNQAMQDLILEGAYILKNGAISISNAASAYIKGFISYMYSSEQIINPDSISDTTKGTFGGINLPIYTKSDNFYLSSEYPNVTISENGNHLFAGFRVDNDVHFLINLSAFLGMQWRIYYSDTDYIQCSAARIRSDLSMRVSNSIITDGCPFPNILDYYSSLDDFYNALTNDDFTNLDSSTDIPSGLVGDQSIFNDRSDTLSPSADENTVFLPPLVGALPGTGSVTIPDYLDAINDLINDGIADIPIADSVTDVASPVTVTDIDLTDTVPAVDPVEEQDNIGSTAVIDPDIPLDPDVDTINTLAFDLREIFPFCIPFDLYNLISKFVAEPEAPHWQISIPLPLNLPALEFEIDLSGFESAAVVLRSFEMVVFVASLAVATRSIYLRG